MAAKPKHYDLVIIGAGAAGLTVAAVSAQLGYNVALLEKGKMGGDCLNDGCVPSKALLSAAKAAHIAQTADKFGIKADVSIDFKKVHQHVKKTIASIAPHDSQERFEGLGVEVIRHAGRFLDENTVEAGPHRLMAKRFVVATGSSPFVPPISGLEDVPFLTNKSIFDLTDLPQHLLVLGGGPIGVEMAQAFRRFGSAVTIIEGAETILTKDDPEAVKVVTQQLKAEKIDLKTGKKVTKTSKIGEKITLTLEGKGKKETTSGTHLFVATGRMPNVENLGLKAANIDFSPRGIAVNSQMRTTNPKVFALGDVAGPYQFTHMAGHQATWFIQRVLFGNIFLKAKYANLPWVTYTDPELAQVGLMEADARKKYGDTLAVTKVNLKEVDRAQTEAATEGFVKVMHVKGLLVGATLVGKNAGEMLPLWAFMITHKRKLRDISAIILPYPTWGEVAKKIVSAAYKDVLLASKTKALSRFLFRWFG